MKKRRRRRRKNRILLNRLKMYDNLCTFKHFSFLCLYCHLRARGHTLKLLSILLEMLMLMFAKIDFFLLHLIFQFLSIFCNCFFPPLISIRCCVNVEPEHSFSKDSTVCFTNAILNEH